LNLGHDFQKTNLTTINLEHYVLVMLLCVINFVYATDDVSEQLLLCRAENSVALRLNCYDKIKLIDLIKLPQGLTNIKAHEKQLDHDIKRSSVALKAVELESKRLPFDDHFLVMHNIGDISPEIIITTPAINISDNERPILVFSCVDKITRLQIVLFAPVKHVDKNLELNINNFQLKTDWFIRDSGYLMEYSRGLPSVHLIKKIMQSDVLAVEHVNSTLRGATFNVANLAQTIMPLRSACTW